MLFYYGSRILAAAALCFMVSSAARAQSSTPSPGCTASIEEAMGEHAECRLEAEASFEKNRRADRLQRARRRCDREFKRDFRRARRRHGEENCTPASVETLQGHTEGFVSTTVNAAKGVDTERLGSCCTKGIFREQNGSCIQLTQLECFGNVAARPDAFCAHDDSPCSENFCETPEVQLLCEQ